MTFENAKLAAVYPGQGSQAVGMGRDFFDNFSYIKALFEEASDTLSLDFRKLLFKGPDDVLQLTANTQPALLLVSVGAHRVLQEEAGFSPLAGAGHSVGEYAALVGAGVVPFAQALRAVRIRGEAMQSAVPVNTGGMVAVLGPDEADVQKICSWAMAQSHERPIEIANINAPGQTVISGNKKALDWLVDNFNAEAAGMSGKRAKFIPLKVSAPFHCSLMKPAEEALRAHLKSVPFHEAIYPVVQNFNAQTVVSANELKENLIRQVSAPVRWIECVHRLAHQAPVICELGHGKVLTGLIKKINPELRVLPVSDINDLKGAIDVIAAI
jgi:[acyl-carrier-protein] S-malonyltransferase